MPTPKGSSRSKHDDDEDDDVVVKPKKRSRDADEEEDDDDAPRSKKSGKSSGRAPTSKRPNGWAAVATKQEEFAERKEKEENSVRDFWLKAGETAVIQFLHDEPFTFDGHNIKDKHGNFKFIPCQLLNQKYCLMCRESLKMGWKAAFKILDYRGTWKKAEGSKKGKFLWDKPIEKLWFVNMTILGQLQAQKAKKKKELSEMVLEVSRTGQGKNDTSYNFETAVDEDDVRMKPVKFKEQAGPVNELVAIPSDEDLEKIGFEAPDED